VIGFSNRSTAGRTPIASTSSSTIRVDVARAVLVELDGPRAVSGPARSAEQPPRDVRGLVGKRAIVRLVPCRPRDTGGVAIAAGGQEGGLATLPSRSRSRARRFERRTSAERKQLATGLRRTRGLLDRAGDPGRTGRIRSVVLWWRNGKVRATSRRSERASRSGMSQTVSDRRFVFIAAQ